jgi:hypothetical protein
MKISKKALRELNNIISDTFIKFLNEFYEDDYDFNQSIEFWDKDQKKVYDSFSELQIKVLDSIQEFYGVK